MGDWKILKGLPAEGPLAVPFSTNGRGTHSEGLVVEFVSETGERWVGNFQPGITEFTGVLAYPPRWCARSDPRTGICGRS